MPVELVSIRGAGGLSKISMAPGFPRGGASILAAADWKNLEYFHPVVVLQAFGLHISDVARMPRDCGDYLAGCIEVFADFGG
jgi:hypothetical protein